MPKIFLIPLSESSQQFLITIVAWIAWHLAKPYIGAYLPLELVNIVDVALPGAGALALHQMFSEIKMGQRVTHVALAETKVAAFEAKDKAAQVADKVEKVEAVTAKMDPQTTADVEKKQEAIKTNGYH